jgi:hypothetical protein
MVPPMNGSFRLVENPVNRLQIAERKEGVGTCADLPPPGLQLPCLARMLFTGRVLRSVNLRLSNWKGIASIIRGDIGEAI